MNADASPTTTPAATASATLATAVTVGSRPVATKADPASPSKVERAADRTVGLASNAQAPSAPDDKVDHATAPGTDGDGAAAPIAQADVAQSRADTGAQGADAPSLSVPLHRASETLNATVTTMAKSGLTQARINLTPESLGGVKVVLTQTDNGLVARVVADHAEAAQTLAASAGELRRNLEANGATLASLDFGTADGSGGGDTNGSSQNGAFQYASQHGSGNPGYGELSDTADDESTQTRQLTVALGDGSLVNVLA